METHLPCDEILQNFGGTIQNDLNEILLTRDQSNADIDISSHSPYVLLQQLCANITKYPNGFSLLSLNCQSIHAKFDHIKFILAELHKCKFTFSAICLQETWLKGRPPDITLFQLPGYKAFALGASCSVRGGLLIYVSDQYETTIRYSHDNSNIWEGLFLNITGNNIHPMTLGTVYRPPRQNNNNPVIDMFLKEFVPVIENLGRDNKNAILTGDFNIDLTQVHEREKYAEFLDVMMNNGFLPKIMLPTRFALRTASLLDQIFVKEIYGRQTISKSAILHSAISDHLACLTFLEGKYKKHNDTDYITFQVNDEGSINRFVSEIANSQIMEKLDRNILQDPNVTYNKINDVLQKAKDKHIPLKTVKFNKYKHKKSDWITTGIMKSIHFRDKLYAKLLKCDHNSLRYQTMKTNFRTYSVILRKSIREAKKKFYDNEFEKYRNDIKKTWKTINSILNRNVKKDSIKHIITENGKITNIRDIVENMNQYFANIGEALASSIPQPNKRYNDYLKKTIMFSFSFSLTTEEQITKIIDKMKPKTSTGHDDISMKLLKQIKEYLAGPISLLTNQSLTTGIFPNLFKIAKVLPLSKKPNNYNLKNFRPISLLPVISKILEKAVFTQVYDYFDSNGLFYKSQYGYRKKHSTETACLELVDSIYTEIDQKHIPLSLYLDLSKAFDTINHFILLDKLYYYGIRGMHLDWFRSYLSNRSQYVEMDNEKSGMRNINIGVPQGSILGPLLFIIYMDDISTVSDKFRFILYADDTSLNSTVCTFKAPISGNISTNINNELDKIKDWLFANKLSLNIGKTKFMVFRLPQQSSKRLPKLNLQINNISIEQVHEFDFLGLTLTDTMSWKAHCDKIALKISKVIGVMCKIKHVLTRSILLKIYHTLILSHLHYAILCWGFDHRRLEKLQKKAIRIICKRKYNAHTDPLFKELKLLKLKDIFNIQCVKFFYKHERGDLPQYFDSMYHRNSLLHNYNTRNRDNLHLYHSRTKAARNCIRYQIPIIINNLPVQLKSKIYTHSLQALTNNTKIYLIGEYEENCQIRNCYICRF